MCKSLAIVALMVSVVLVAALVPSTSQAFLGPVWTPFSWGSLLGSGGDGCYGGYGYAGYGGYGYAGYGGAGYYGSPYGYGGRHMHRGARHGH